MKDVSNLVDIHKSLISIPLTVVARLTTVTLASITVTVTICFIITDSQLSHSTALLAVTVTSIITQIQQSYWLALLSLSKAVSSSLTVN